ncbi:unnamed protein product [Rotaria magnacalcarata]|uniref:Uncharacterized protein n=2 Tax=Rotaria magnacalcarata TaxID=392030 RepID=A0A816T7E4_9BILA|nr:unnamed protein product [Rotaria magnacalcarata]
MFEDLYESVLLTSSSALDSLKPLFEYYENYWVKTIGIKRWNVYGIRIKTNNNAEGFHNRLNLRVAKHHPNIWIFIRCIQGEAICFNHVLIQMIGGLTYRTKTAATNAIQQRIDILYLRYQIMILLLMTYYSDFLMSLKKYIGEKKKIINYIDSLKLINLFICQLLYI